LKLHQKGFLLTALSRESVAWDYALVARTVAEYGVAGRRGINAIRIALDEMASAGLIERVEERLDDGAHFAVGKVLFRYRLTDFGRRRMQDTGLPPA
jgi:hypothetical protein